MQVIGKARKGRDLKYFTSGMVKEVVARVIPISSEEVL